MSIEAINLFLDMITAEKGSSHNTAVSYQYDLIQFFDITKTNARNITRKHISDYVQELANLHYAPKSQARKLSAVREFCKFLLQEKILTDNPCLNIITPKLEKKIPNFLSPSQIKILIETAKKQPNFSIKRIGVMINLMFATGLRVSELIQLSENSINYDKKIVTVIGKGNKERIIPIAEHARNDVRDYANTYRQVFIKKRKVSAWLFPSLRSASGHITRDAFFKCLRTLAINAELNPDIISPHTLRHSFATNLINNDSDLRSVQKMLGHENIATTEIYTHILKEKLADTVMKKHPLASVNFKSD